MSVLYCVRLHQTNKENAGVIAALREQVAALEDEKLKQMPIQGKKKKKKTARDYEFPAASYAEEEDSGDVGVVIEQYASQTGPALVLTSSTVHGHKDTFSSELLEYGTLDGFEDHDGHDGRDDASAGPQSSREAHATDRVAEERRPYNPAKYGDQRDMRESINSIATAETGSSEQSYPARGGVMRRSHANSDTMSSSICGTVNGSTSNGGSIIPSPKRVTETTPDGVKIVKYSNGTVKRVHPNGLQEVVFLNGDSKVTHKTGTIVYFYANAQTTHTTYLDGSEVYEFPNNQVIHLPWASRICC